MSDHGKFRVGDEVRLDYRVFSRIDPEEMDADRRGRGVVGRITAEKGKSYQGDALYMVDFGANPEGWHARRVAQYSEKVLLAA